MSPPSSTGLGGVPSSPFMGTDHTYYSPEAARNGGRSNLNTESKAAGKKPIPEVKFIRHTTYTGLDPHPHRQAVFLNEIDTASLDFISRYILVKKVPNGTHYIEAGNDHEAELARVEEVMKLYKMFNTCVPIYNRGIYLRWDNICDAVSGKETLEQFHFGCFYVDNYGFALAKSQDTGAIDEFEGQLRIEVIATPVVPGIVTLGFNDLRLMHDEVELALSRFGAIRDFLHVSTDHMAMKFAFRFEYFSVEAANRARASIMDQAMERHSDNGLWTWTIDHAENWTGPRAPNSPHRRLPRVDDKGRFMELRHPEMMSMTPSLTAPNDRANELHNRVCRIKIEEGADVRTTIMLRNIPNKLDWMTLKSLLDRICFGTYDFIYLRIDFKSGHNVGYAFINFVDIKGMLSMIDHVEHRGWPGYRSSKNAELSYATIQGRESLVQKFRNSSVMQQTPYCRPRLFVTKQEAWISKSIRKCGVEIDFPAPDNWSKFQRSIDSARTVGLFPPTGVQSTDRAHTSTFDRGTPRDMAHMYNQFGTLPASIGYTDDQKEYAEKMYGQQFGPAYAGNVGFENIPIRILVGYIGNPASAYARPSPGPIARPIGPQGQGYDDTPSMPGFGFAGPAYPAQEQGGLYGQEQGHIYGQFQGDFEDGGFE